MNGEPAGARADIHELRLLRHVVVVGSVIVAVTMAVRVPVPMMMIAPAAQEPGARDVHSEAEAGDRDRFAEVNRHRRKQARHRLVADQEGDHRQHNRAGEAGQVPQLARAEAEPRVVRVAAREGVGERGEKQRAGVRRHVQAVGDQSDRAEQQPAGDLNQHHGPAKPDHDPGAALVASVTFAEKDVVMVKAERHGDHRRGRGHFR